MTVSTAYVLAAGLGTRLRPLTNHVPKPLVEVCGTPLVNFTLALLARAGVTQVALNSHWLHPALPDTLGAQFLGMRLVFTHEPTLVGTGGGLSGLARALPAAAGERVLVMNADALIDLDVAALIASARAGDLASLVLKADPDAARYGALGTNIDDAIVTLPGRIDAPLFATTPPLRHRMFCGVHLMDPRVLSVLPPVTVDASGTVRGPASGINDEGYPVWMRQGAVLRAFDHDGTFCDVGTPERLLEANLSVLSGLWDARHLQPFAQLQQPEPGVYVHPTASISPLARLTAPVLVDAGAHVGPGAQVGPFVVVGKHCRVSDRARLAAAVLQSHSVVSDVVVDSIVAPHCRLAVDASVGQGVRERARYTNANTR